MRKFPFVPFAPRFLGGLVIAGLLIVAAWAIIRHPAPHAARASIAANRNASPSPVGPPWVYGRADARFTVIEYADLECPYCRAYFPVLKGWIDAHPDVNWQWQHLPLAIHEPAATADARLAECAGETAGNAAFWKAVTWIYAHTGGDGQGLPHDARYPDLTPAMRHCLASDRPDAAIRGQAAAALRDRISGTPTLRLQDHHSGKTIVLPGSVEGDALLSAMDWLASQPEETPPAPARP